MDLAKIGIKIFLHNPSSQLRLGYSKEGTFRPGQDEQAADHQLHSMTHSSAVKVSAAHQFGMPQLLGIPVPASAKMFPHLYAPDPPPVCAEKIHPEIGLFLRQAQCSSHPLHLCSQLFPSLMNNMTEDTRNMKKPSHAPNCGRSDHD